MGRVPLPWRWSRGLRSSLDDCPLAFVDLPDSVEVLRFVPTKDDFLPKGARLPTRKAFEPSSSDKAEGAARGRPPSISVWDRRRATVVQVRTLRPTAPLQAAFSLQVQTVVAIGVSGNDRHLRVLTDPIVPTIGPGSFAHAGIEGCASPKGRSKIEHKAMLDRLAEACVPADE